MARRRVISESLNAEEQAMFRGEMDVAQRIALNRSTSSHAEHAEGKDGGETMSDARTMRSYSRTSSMAAKRRRGGGRTKRAAGRGSKILRRPEKRKPPSDGRTKRTCAPTSSRGSSTAQNGTHSPLSIEEYYGEFEKGVKVEESLGLVDIQDWVRSIEVKEFEEWNKERREREPVRIEDVVLRDNTTEDTLDGDAIVDLWFRCMGKIEERLTLSEQQKDFIQSCFISLLPLIYGDQFDVNIVRLTKRFGIDAIFKKIFFEMPRRFGKTTSTAIVAAIIAHIIPGLTVGIYSIVKSASDSLVESAIDYYETISGWDRLDFVVEWNKQKGRVQVKNAHGSTSTVWGYSAVSTVSFIIYLLSLKLAFNED